MVEATASDASVQRKPRMRNLVRCTLGVVGVSLILAVMANVSLYMNNDFLPDEVKGPHPLAGRIGVASLFAGMFMAVCAAPVSFLAIPLGLFRAPRLLNVGAASAGLFLSLSAFGFHNTALTRVRANPARFRAREVARLAVTVERYAGKRGGCLPPSTSWCETLTEFDPNVMRYLTYPLRDEPAGSSTLALNGNLDSKRLAEFPDDVVLLFGTKIAPNPVGDHTLLTSDNYDGKGAVVLFGGLHVEFVKTSDFSKLRWQP